MNQMLIVICLLSTLSTVHAENSECPSPRTDYEQAQVLVPDIKIAILDTAAATDRESLVLAKDELINLTQSLNNNNDRVLSAMACLTKLGKFQRVERQKDILQIYQELQVSSMVLDGHNSLKPEARELIRHAHFAIGTAEGIQMVLSLATKKN